MPEQTAISPTRQEDFPEWYQQVIRAADLAENSEVRGCMVIKPWGYRLRGSGCRRVLDGMFKATGHQQCLLPAFHTAELSREGGRARRGLRQGMRGRDASPARKRRDGKPRSVPAPLDEPLIVRPDIGDDHWCSLRALGKILARLADPAQPMGKRRALGVAATRLFLRTTEFLWQEGHTAHETEAEAREETMRMLRVYETFARDFLAIPVISGEKTESERFPGRPADALHRGDGRRIERHPDRHLAFPRAKFFEGIGHRIPVHARLDRTRLDNKLQGISTRLIGTLIMTHGDDDGLALPPRIAPVHAVIIPITPKEEARIAVLEAADKIAASLREVRITMT